MGFYINPKGESKEQFLQSKGKRIGEREAIAFREFKGDALPVCLVDNVAFTAAGIAYCREERDEFAHPDPRDKKWYLVPKADLKPFAPDQALNYYTTGAGMNEEA